jgi:hypothetical protein
MEKSSTKIGSMDPQCDNCRFYRIMKANDATLVTTCRRYPPKIFVVPIPSPTGQLSWTSNTSFPLVAPSSWCGMYEPVPVGKSN